jgi:signal transduction histidine kinase
MLRAPWSRYAIALLVASAALYLRHLVAPLLGGAHAYHTVWPAVAFCAWFCGLGPAAVASLVMLLGTWYWFLPPPGSFALEDPQELFSIAGFAVFASAIIFIGERARRMQAALRAAHCEMEATVQQRTAELTEANQELRKLSTSLRHAQDEERRRLARDLHDSVGQLLAGIGMNLGSLRLEKLSDPGAHALKDVDHILAQATQEVRSLSHLLHPPMLEEAGLCSALQIYLDGFSQRSGIGTALRASEDLPRLSEELEIAIFRIVQEALTNAHKHAAARTITVLLAQAENRIVVQISDDGKGIPRAKAPGVGLTGMQERVRELGGKFELESSKAGTEIKATFPLTLAIRRQKAATASQ